MLTSFLCGEFFLHVVVEVLLCVHRNRRFIRDRSGHDVPHVDFHTAPEPRSASVTHPVLTFKSMKGISLTHPVLTFYVGSFSH